MVSLPLTLESDRTPVLLYSTNTWLAYGISEQYYNGAHYVWCTPYFDPRLLESLEPGVPPTSSPYEVYRSLYDEVQRGDRHSAKIKENKAGILRGASFKRQTGVITEQQERDIASIVELAESRDFKPLIYVIPYTLVAELLREVPIGEKAHPLSREYLIDALPRKYFDVLEFSILRSW